MKDYFYKKIIEGLNSDLDDKLFELCIADILRDDYPTLVPISGGSDDGMDGAIGELQGDPIPLIITTSKDVIGNLTRNIKKYKQEGGKKRKVVLATSQKLTKQRINNLISRAEELGFKLLQYYAQEAIALRLYRNYIWCKELLGVTGEPQALSLVPKTKRVLYGSMLIGREDDIKKLNNLKTDFVLSGQPGSGKTFLLSNFIKENKALFCVSNNMTYISNEFRESKPKFLIIDDVHDNKDELLQDLIHFREETKAKFNIIVTCWPSYKDKYLTLLSLQPDNSTELDLLPRDKILETVNSTGLKGPPELLARIVDQSIGKPGLAVELSLECIKGSVEDVFNGEALLRNIRYRNKDVIDKKTLFVLAAFAIGGDSGFKVENVAEGLAMSIIDISSIVTELSSAGIVQELSQNRLSVLPMILRGALVKGIFFNGVGSLPYDYFIQNSINPAHTMQTLILAKASGAKIESNYIRELLKESNVEESWIAYAWLGEKEAEFVLNNKPDLLLQLSRVCLTYIPVQVLPLLIEKAKDDDRPLNQYSDHPIRIIEDWIESAMPGAGQALVRRELLLGSIEEWLELGNEKKVAFKILKDTFSIKFEDHTVDPGLGNTVTLTNGLINLDEFEGLFKFWPRVLKLFEIFGKDDLSELIGIINSVSSPYIPNGSVPDRYRSFSKTVARKMIIDVLKLFGGNSGFLVRLKEIVSRLNVRVSIKIDPEFLIIFPERNYNDDWKKIEEVQTKKIKKLAKKLNEKKYYNIIEYILNLNKEAIVAGREQPNYTNNLFAELAETTEMEYCKWVDAMIQYKAKSDFIYPFIRKMIREKEKNWQKHLGVYLENEELQPDIVLLLLNEKKLSTKIIDVLMSMLPKYSRLVELSALRGNIDEKILLKLLQHESDEVKFMTAIGMFKQRDKVFFEDNIYSLWKNAILDVNFNEINMNEELYWLEKLLVKYEDLAYEFICQNLKKKFEFFYSDGTGFFQNIVEKLNEDQRREIINMLPEDFSTYETSSFLVGNNVTLYDSLLRKKHLESMHLEPLVFNLSNKLSDEVAELYKLAVKYGYKHIKIARAILGLSYSTIGNWSDYWNKWIAFFEDLKSHDDRNLKIIAKEGLTIVNENYNYALERERYESIHGIN